jgi:hypothetical protein
MKLSDIRKGKRPAPDRVLVYGPEGIGKTTFGANAPKPIFLSAEDGNREFAVDVLPEPASFADVLDRVDFLIANDTGYKTLVIDTVDWLAPLVTQAVLERNNWTIEQFNDFGRGCKAWTQDWRVLLARLDKLRLSRDMEIIALAHTRVTSFRDPAGADWMRYVPKLVGEEAPALWKEWADVVMFAQDKVTVKGETDRGKAKGISDGRRVLRTERNAAFDAKNRKGLPPEIPLDYAAYAHARDNRDAKAADMLAEAEKLIASAGLGEEALKWVRSHKDDTMALAVDINRLKILVDKQSNAA